MSDLRLCLKKRNRDAGQTDIFGPSSGRAKRVSADGARGAGCESLTPSLRAADRIGDSANPVGSEAIQKAATGLDCFVARAPRNDGCTAASLKPASLILLSKSPNSRTNASQPSLRVPDRIGDFANLVGSEAIQKAATGLDCFVARAPRNDGCTAPSLKPASSILLPKSPNSPTNASRPSLRVPDRIGDSANPVGSEAIQKAATGLDCFVARAPRNDGCTAASLKPASLILLSKSPGLRQDCEAARTAGIRAEMSRCREDRRVPDNMRLDRNQRLAISGRR